MKFGLHLSKTLRILDCRSLSSTLFTPTRKLKESTSSPKSKSSTPPCLWSSPWLSFRCTTQLRNTWTIIELILLSLNLVCFPKTLCGTSFLSKTNKERSWDQLQIWSNTLRSNFSNFLMRVTSIAIRGCWKTPSIKTLRCLKAHTLSSEMWPRDPKFWTKNLLDTSGKRSAKRSKSTNSRRDQLRSAQNYEREARSRSMMWRTTSDKSLSKGGTTRQSPKKSSK